MKKFTIILLILLFSASITFAKEAEATQDKSSQFNGELHNAVYDGNIEMINYWIVIKGVDVNEIDHRTGKTALHVASRIGDKKAVKALLEHGADTHILDEQGLSPHDYADSLSMRILLMTEKKTPKDNLKTLFYAIHANKSEEFNYLLSKEIDLNGHQQKTGLTALHLAAVNDRTNMLEALLKHGANTEARESSELNSTPIYLASQFGKTLSVKILLEYGANVNARTENKWTALHIASLTDKYNVVETLLEHGADVDIQNELGETALSLASSSGHLRLAKILLEHGADPDIQTDDHGFTALHVVAKANKVKAVRALLEYGANPNITDKAGLKPRYYAKSKGVIRLLDQATKKPETIPHREMPQIERIPGMIEGTI